MVIAATDCVDRPEAAVADPVWRRRGGSGGFRLADLLRGPWDRWRTETAERAAAAEESQRELEAFLSSERLRETLQDLNRNWSGINTYDEHLQYLSDNDNTTLRLLLNQIDPMTPLEHRAWGFFAQRTEISPYLGKPIAVSEEFPMSSEEREAVTSLARTGSRVSASSLPPCTLAIRTCCGCSARSGSSTRASCSTTKPGATP